MPKLLLRPPNLLECLLYNCGKRRSGTKKGGRGVFQQSIDPEPASTFDCVRFRHITLFGGRVTGSSPGPGHEQTQGKRRVVITDGCSADACGVEAFTVGETTSKYPLTR